MDNISLCELCSIHIGDKINDSMVKYSPVMMPYFHYLIDSTQDGIYSEIIVIVFHIANTGIRCDVD